MPNLQSRTTDEQRGDEPVISILRGLEDRKVPSGQHASTSRNFMNLGATRRYLAPFRTAAQSVNRVKGDPACLSRSENGVGAFAVRKCPGALLLHRAKTTHARVPVAREYGDLRIKDPLQRGHKVLACIKIKDHPVRVELRIILSERKLIQRVLAICITQRTSLDISFRIFSNNSHNLGTSIRTACNLFRTKKKIEEEK